MNQIKLNVKLFGDPGLADQADAEFVLSFGKRKERADLLALKLSRAKVQHVSEALVHPQT